MRIERVTVGPDRINVVVTMAEPEPRRRVGRAAAARALELLPSLASHHCENRDGRGFVDEIAETEVPHLFEHITLELMAQAGSPRSLRGETSWDFRRDGRGVYHVSLEYDDDLVCLGAIKAAAELVRVVADGGALPDIAGTVQRLTTLRQPSA